MSRNPTNDCKQTVLKPAEQRASPKYEFQSIEHGSGSTRGCSTPRTVEISKSPSAESNRKRGRG